MVETNEKRKIAVVGVGVIGASWVAYFLAHGFDVAATDPAEGAEMQLRTLVDRFWPALERMGLKAGASRDRLCFYQSVADTVAGAYLVQENGPERHDIKRALIAEIDAFAPPDALIATSSSGIVISDIQDAAKRPERVLLGHPFNPPHLIPLVEVIGGRLTSKDAISRAMDFYHSIGKRAIHIRKEVKGHVANRLQAALWREAFYLVKEGVVSVSDLDTAIASGPGLRWALLGPFMNLELSGGAGGIAHMLEHLGPPIDSWWKDLGDVTIDHELISQLAQGVQDELGERDIVAVQAERDDVLLSLLALKDKSSGL
jgi:carnitine 3-dehydrogenase